MKDEEVLKFIADAIKRNGRYIHILVISLCIVFSFGALIKSRICATTYMEINGTLFFYYPCDNNVVLPEDNNCDWCDDAWWEFHIINDTYAIPIARNESLPPMISGTKNMNEILHYG